MQLIKEIYWTIREWIFGRALKRPSNFEVKS